MGNIITFITIIWCLLLPFWSFHPEFIDEDKIFSEIQLEGVPSWHLDNKLTTKENLKVLNLIKTLEVRRLSSGSSTYLTQDNFIIYSRSKENFANLYTIVINPEEQIGKIIKSGSDKFYVFEINQEKIDTLQNIFNEYYQLAFD